MVNSNRGSFFEQGNRSTTRRDLLRLGLKGAAAASILASADLAGWDRLRAAEAPAPAPAPETLVKQLYQSLTDEQRKAILFPFDHPLRSKVDNNWHIVDRSIGQLLTRDQQDLVHQIFMDMHSPEYAPKVLAQVEHDNVDDGGFSGCAVALFGEPGSSKFEFVFTGRHVTRRCDGNSVEGAAFGGPIFYGHAADGFNEKANHPGNIYWYQAVRANELFTALDGKQREQALRNDPRKERGTKPWRFRRRVSR